jgi:MFS family permease
MFKSLGKGFLDTFRMPSSLIWGYILMFCLAFGSILLFTFTFDYLPFDATGNTFLLVLLKNYLWIFVVYLAFYLIVAYFMSLFMAYVINKKTDSESKYQGTGKIFGFTLFLSIISLLPGLIFGLFDLSLTISIIYIILSLFYVFFIYPVLLCVPILLVKNDLKYSLSESFKFSKQHYGWIIILQILFVILIMILSSVLDYLSVYLTEFGSTLIFLIVFVILFLWVIHFVHNWYYDKPNEVIVSKVNEKNK